MDNISLDYFPIIILVLAFFMKISIGRGFALGNYGVGLLELPVDLFFVSISIFATTILTHSNDIQQKIQTLIIYLIFAVVSAILWRFNETLFLSQTKKRWWCALLIPANIIIAFYFFMKTIDLVKQQ
ncbi:hypothetical protein SOV88_11620 [Pectobacterium brasiliense]|uniref:hypothetical protein n=1 Tax=Pectobacterium brasiliense TaxID=180957 RepID=UPI002A7F95D4|nr:hypothetical protein [Pectobacterium brasiliense]MDY4324919.1 hypothetical protein [Pectobacterium brasiliense]